MLWRKKNSYKEFDNEKKFPFPPPPITFLMVRPLERWTYNPEAPSQSPAVAASWVC